MDDANEPIEQNEAPLVSAEPVAPIQSRFLFVDVAALRARQLHRGARVRIDEVDQTTSPASHKPERLAMEEVRRGLVYYSVPDRVRMEAEA
jgi:DNA-directed RNA polymerase omega subunit